jgi:NADPH:quinone reductase-like Zn-dependent oxidoreductase
MENMKAVQIHNYGGPEVLHFEDAPRPTPGSGGLLIRVHAASVNAIDWKARAGYLKDIFTLPLPYIPGWDVSGIVEAIGPGVTQFKKGDEIYTGPGWRPQWQRQSHLRGICRGQGNGSRPEAKVH